MVAGRMTEEQKMLVVENMHIADRYVQYNYIYNPAIAGFTQEDLRQTGYLALCKAALYYNGQVKFVTYAQKVLKSSLAEYCAEKLAGTMRLSQDVQLGSDEDESNLYGLIVDSGAQNDFSQIEMQDIFTRCKQKYSGVIRKGIEAMELKMRGFTGPEIAEIYGCDANDITAWISRARQKLRTDPVVLSAVS